MADRFTQFFKAADTDNSGFLTQAELGAVLKKQGYSDDKIQKMFRSTDMTGDNKISLQEFLEAMGQVPPTDHKIATAQKTFREFDLDGNGKVDRKELGKIFEELGSSLSQAEIDRMMQLADKDGSGFIDYEEFVKQVFSS